MLMSRNTISPALTHPLSLHLAFTLLFAIVWAATGSGYQHYLIGAAVWLVGGIAIWGVVMGYWLKRHD